MTSQQENKKTPLWKKIIGGLFFIAFCNAIIGIVSDANRTQSGSSASATVAPKISPKEEALRDLKLDFEWGKGGFGSVMFVDLKFTNNGKHAVKDIEVVCRSAANSGTIIDKNKKTVYEAVQPGETKNIQRFNMGFLNSQATSTSCAVENLKIEQ